MEGVRESVLARVITRLRRFLFSSEWVRFHLDYAGWNGVEMAAESNLLTIIKVLREARFGEWYACIYGALIASGMRMSNLCSLLVNVQRMDSPGFNSRKAG